MLYVHRTEVHVVILTDFHHTVFDIYLAYRRTFKKRKVQVVKWLDIMSPQGEHRNQKGVQVKNKSVEQKKRGLPLSLFNFCNVLRRSKGLCNL